MLLLLFLLYLSFVLMSQILYSFLKKSIKFTWEDKEKRYIFFYRSVKVSKVGDHSRGRPEGSLFDSLLHQGVGEGATPFPGLLHFTLDPYLIMLSVKQGGIK